MIFREMGQKTHTELIRNATSSREPPNYIDADTKIYAFCKAMGLEVDIRGLLARLEDIQKTVHTERILEALSRIEESDDGLCFR